MALRLAVRAVVVPRQRRALKRGESAMLCALVIRVSFAVGVGPGLTSILLALSARIGPVAATGLVGLILLLACGIEFLAWRNRQPLAPVPSGIGSAELPASGPILLCGLAMSAGLRWSPDCCASIPKFGGWP